MFDFFLSEMSVSNSHGGGLTLQRVLKDELDSIPLFVHLSKFAQTYPPITSLEHKSVYLPNWLEADSVKKMAGNLVSEKLTKNFTLKKAVAKRNAALLHKHLPDKQVLRGLICPQQTISMQTLEAVKTLRKVDYVTWIMDDHLVKWNGKEWYYDKPVEKLLQKHVCEAEHVFVISETMQAFYQNKFGVSSTVLFGPAQSNPSNRLHSASEVIKIAYFGSVAGWQIDAIEAVLKAATLTKAELHIYSGMINPGYSEILKSAKLHASLPPGEVVKEMANYDALLLPISFSTRLRNMSEFNIATKMSEYLGSGTPVLAVGPDYAAMIKYLKNRETAITCSSTDENNIRKSIESLKDNNTLSAILRNAQHTVETEVGIIPMRKVWTNATKQ